MALGLICLGLVIGLQYAGLTWYNARQLNQQEIAQSSLRVQAMLNREERVLVAVSDEYGWWSALITALETRDLEWISAEFDSSLKKSTG